jgi:hypothetical protein
MKQERKDAVVKFLQIMLIVGSACLIVFSLLSGSEGGGAMHNMPNALPWILLLIVVCITFRWQMLGGVFLILFGLGTIVFFSAFEFLWILFLISLPIIIIGLLFSFLT